MADLSTTLCWWCENAVPSENTGCSWSQRFEPVEGWRATERTLQTDERVYTTYNVHWCPEYKRERRENNATN